LAACAAAPKCEDDLILRAFAMACMQSVADNEDFEANDADLQSGLDELASGRRIMHGEPALTGGYGAAVAMTDDDLLRFEGVSRSVLEQRIRVLVAAVRSHRDAVEEARQHLLLDGCLTCRGARDYKIMLENLTAVQALSTRQLEELRAYRASQVLPGLGWDCPGCGAFNGDVKERLKACRCCGTPRPT
jgi:hypothetical protein